MKKIVLFILVFTVLVLSAAADEDVSAGKQLVESKVACEQLTAEQLEQIGDYYMELMNPGEAHTLMNQMMGGEGSLSLQRIHILMAKRLYCNENVNYNMMQNGMMGMMQGGMMNMAYNGMIGSGYGMMGNVGYWNINSILYVLLLIGLVVLVWLWVWKLWTGMDKKQNKKR